MRKTGGNGGAKGAEKVDLVREWENRIVQGDCLSVLAEAPDNFVDLIVTSPPYADSRMKTYGGVPPDEYVEWFMPIADQLRRVLKPEGTFVLNIKEKVVDGQRHTYVMELIIEMRKRGWLWTEEYIWHKKNMCPGKWPDRFRDAWERCLQFNKQKSFAMYQEAVMVPMGEWAKTRLKNLSETDRRRDNSKTGSGFGKNFSNWLGRDMAYPTNVLHFGTECANAEGHRAPFPSELPEWFIKLFTKEGDLVLDPFLGSGTSAVVAQRLGRKHLGIELRPEYVELAKNALARLDGGAGIVEGVVASEANTIATTGETAAAPPSTGRMSASLPSRGSEPTLFPVEDADRAPPRESP